MSPAKKKNVRKTASKPVSNNKPEMNEIGSFAMPAPVDNLGGTSQDVLEEHYITSWMTPEFVYHEKPTWWHVAAYGFIIIMALLMIFLKEWFGLAVFVLIGILIYQYAEIKPKNIEIALTTVGVRFGNKFYPYNGIKSFWVIYDPPIKTLNLELTKRFSPIITVQLDSIDPVMIKSILREHLLEDSERTEDIIDKLIRMVRF